MTPIKRITFALLWLALLGIAGWWLGQHLQFSGDLRKFMPALSQTQRAGTDDAARAALNNDAPTTRCCNIQRASQ